MPGTKRKHSDDDGLSVDDFVGTAETTIITTNPDACAAVVRAFAGAESFSIYSNVFEASLTTSGSHDVVSKGWDMIKLTTKKEESEDTGGEDSDTSES
ncbi:hypothetical protein PFICI_13541 [Pestalotiopsis fici W106-1]|uniref:Uncharacterized protein n=1 Tax=Pestalotiopsis fici (strain W106-1 / CGMCC3.15140) TaxID=1229662 RepID=W3WPH4_PESFW|nr:uncharacterized protein PFICI_13541 [Pestalotiopsis fici W106-1]ETS75057.1 hypothetical protein PFICI_13541 [Pestalotiopsis fici W106-1]